MAQGMPSVAWGGGRGGCAQTYSVFPKLSHSLPICHYLWSPNYRVSDCVLPSHQCSPAPQSVCLSTWPLAPPPLSRRRSRTPKPSSAPPPGQVTHRLCSGSSALCAKLKVATERCSPIHRTCCRCREITWIQSASPRARRKGVGTRRCLAIAAGLGSLPITKTG